MLEFDFDKIRYRKPRLYNAKRYIEELIGLDTETMTSGKPFMICLSTGDNFTLEQVPQCFFSRKYRNANFCVYNLKFDAGSLIRSLPPVQIKTLQENNEVEYNGYKWRYIPHKMLRISKGKNAIHIWDIFGFFGGSLDAAAKMYLGKQKIELATKHFTASYIKKHYKKILEYCIRDAELAAELGNYLLKRLWDMKIYPNKLYSTASVSFQYFQTYAKIIDVWSYWIWYKELLQYACEAYSGGKFEITARGKFTGYEYDISSAYPYEIANLIDITNAQVKHTKKFQPKAVYAYLRVTIYNVNAVHHSVALKDMALNYYPAGVFDATITLNEYNYFIAQRVKVVIHSGYWIFVARRSYPYRKVIQELYRQKTELKATDKMFSNICKIMMNGFYGKMAQLIPLKDGTYKAGVGWNPIYSSVICANVRLRMSEIQQAYGNKCLAVHTDSVILTCKLAKKYIGQGLGEFEFKKYGKGILVMSGIYQIAEKSADRGYKVPDKFDWNFVFKSIGKRYNKRYDKMKFSWKTLLQIMGKASRVKLQEVRPLSWRQAILRHKPEEINRFIDFPKWFNINMERKRIWLKTINADSLLNKLEYSIPRIEREK